MLLLYDNHDNQTKVLAFQESRDTLGWALLKSVRYDAFRFSWPSTTQVISLVTVFAVCYCLYCPPWHLKGGDDIKRFIPVIDARRTTCVNPMVGFTADTLHSSPYISYFNIVRTRINSPYALLERWRIFGPSVSVSSFPGRRSLHEVWQPEWIPTSPAIPATFVQISIQLHPPFQSANPTTVASNPLNKLSFYPVTLTPWNGSSLLHFSTALLNGSMRFFFLKSSWNPPTGTTLASYSNYLKSSLPCAQLLIPKYQRAA